MIYYHPPKSQVWGHQVGRLSATKVVELSGQLLQEHCTIMNSQPSEPTLGWNLIQSRSIKYLAEEITAALGPISFQRECSDLRPDACGETYRILRWPFTAEHLPSVAAWFDRLSEQTASFEIATRCSIGWLFAWRDEPLPLNQFESAGGSFMIHLGSPHRITTVFSFRDIEKYDGIKAYVKRIGLAKLSDRHLTPKSEMRRLGRAK